MAGSLLGHDLSAVPPGPSIPHGWDVTPREAMALQSELRERVVPADRFGEIRAVAGVDAHFDRARALARAAVCLFSYPELRPIAEAVVEGPLRFPYVPGLLSFREIPPVLDVLEKLPAPPDLILCDGHGYAHPRRFGLACHLGVLTDTPTIGVAKSRLVGEHAEPGPERGARAALVHDGETIGAVVRTRARVRPVYVSVGHRVSLDTAVALVLACTPRWRLAEPIRAADRLASRR